jgi:Retrotransposon gag protein
MENKGIEGDEAKINFIALYLRGKAWNWFEPILCEKEPKKKTDCNWSDRTTRILRSYKEMEKAMAQVFGDVDEQKTAAKQMQKLQQTRSVTEYITGFQMIASNLDWDEEA